MAKIQNKIFTEIWLMESNSYRELVKNSKNSPLKKLSKAVVKTVFDTSFVKTETYTISENSPVVADLVAKKKSNGKPYQVKVIKIQGELVDECDEWESYCYGYCSMHEIGEEITESINNPDISAIILAIDSPGGMVKGIEKLANIVRNSTVPIVSFVSGRCASGAYWVASATKLIVSEETNSMFGSIGAMQIHVDKSGFYELQGEKVTVIASDGSEDKISPNSFAPLDEKGLQNVKSILNGVNDSFKKAVKIGRTDISEDAFTGKMFLAGEALKLNMIDFVGDLQLAANKAISLQTQILNQGEMDKVSVEWFQKQVDAKESEINELKQKVKAFELAATEKAKEPVEKVVALSVVEQIKADYDARILALETKLDKATVFPPLNVSTGSDVTDAKVQELKSWEKADHNAAIREKRASQNKQAK